jgi:ABC-2 type transport system permease protein
MMVSALVLRVGQGAESVAWLAIFLLAPVSAVYYPVATLPDWLQPVCWLLPTAPVFEGMRAILVDDTVRTDLLLHAALVDLAYLALGAGLFLYSFHVARTRGLLLQVGE